MLYRISELFCSAQGEGWNTGTMMSFIRLAGCNLRCSWCDTDHSKYVEMSVPEICKNVKAHRISHACITGGEPTIHNLEPLVDGLKCIGKTICLETNGSNKFNVSSVEWVCVSPKNMEFVLNEGSEIKIPVSKDFTDSEIVELLYSSKANFEQQYLQPVEDDSFNVNVLRTMEFAKCFDVKVSFQGHKRLQIR